MGKLAIIGLGLIGGSLGLAIKRAEPVNTHVIGYDKDPKVTEAALQAGAIEQAAKSVREAVTDANLIIIATPVVAMRRVLEEIAPHLSRTAVVTDTASTKTSVLRWARDILPTQVNFVGGHPMAGKEKSGPQAAEESLFDGRPYCIVPDATTAPHAVQAVLGLVEAVGGEPLFLDAEEHDAYAAAISHMPLISSIALFKVARASSAWQHLAEMSGPAFKDLTRLASGEPEMAHDIILTNRENIGHWLDRYIGELQELRDLVAASTEEDTEKLFRTLVEAQMERDNFIYSPPKREPPAPDFELPSPGDTFKAMMIGSLWENRTKELVEAMERREREKSLQDRIRQRAEDARDAND